MGSERAGDEVRGESSFPSTLRPCAGRKSQEQPLPPNADLLVPGEEPAVLRPVR